MKGRMFAASLMLAGLLLRHAGGALADEPLPESDLELAQRYAPILYFHAAEVFRPQPADVIVEQARLRQSRRLWFDVNVLLSLDVLDLFDLESDESHFLDVWYGDDGSSAYTNYTAHRAYYRAALSPSAGGAPITVYARVVRDEVPGIVTIQYWALYYYNDWFNKHEGDWEMVQVILAQGGPEWVVLSQHHGGTRRAWARTPVVQDTHPATYVALGSHANYFVGDEVYPNAKDIGNERVEIMDRTGSYGGVIPEVILMPDRETLAEEPDAWPGMEWLPFRGHWGEMAAQGDFGGPLGPPDKGAQWETPYGWGMAQPLDVDTWYANRLRVEALGTEAAEMQVYLHDAVGSGLAAAEELGNLAMLHVDPPPGGVTAVISGPARARYDVIARWPDAAAGHVVELYFSDVQLAEPGVAIVELRHGGEARLAVGGSGQEVKPSQRNTVEATWDAPDLVWMGGILPAHQVGLGLLLSALAGVVPMVAYVGALYWMDRYEKEPRHLLMAAFVWGAIPSVLMALAVELFFDLPPDLIGRQALEAVRLGLVAPVLQEVLKGAAVLFIAWRYRREFDNVLDGIVYGAMVGFGFAMTGNIISYLGSFLLWGFDGLSAITFAEGVVYGLNSAFYTALFGAGLGFARLARRQWQRWLFPVGGFVLAVATHASHNLIARSLLGLSVLTVVATMAGVLLIVIAGAWSLARQQRCLRVELKGVIPNALYRTMTVPGARARAKWRTLWSGGIGAWRRARRLQQSCAELAFKRMQARLRPDEPAMAEEAEALRTEIERLANAR